MNVHPHGYWLDSEGHHFDSALADTLVDFFGAGTTVADLGCGKGDYVKRMRERGILANGWDGNPSTALHSHCAVMDLAIEQHLHVHDWVLSLEVGEHIPFRYLMLFLDNLTRHSREGIVLSWAVPGQGGKGHVSEQHNEWVRAEVEKRGFSSDHGAEATLRKTSTLWWFKNTLMVFRNKEAQYEISTQS